MRQPDDMGRFYFVVVSSLRAAQLMRGCTPLIDTLGHKKIVTAQREVAEGAVIGTRVVPPVNGAAQVEPEPEPALVVPA